MESGHSMIDGEISGSELVSVITVDLPVYLVFQIHTSFSFD